MELEVNEGTEPVENAGETAADAKRLVRLLELIVIFSLCFATIHLLVWAVTKASLFLVLSVTTLGMAVAVAACIRTVRRRGTESGALLFCVTMLAIISLVFVIIPWAHNLISIAALLPAMIAIIYARGRVINGVTAASLAVVALTMGYGALHPELDVAIPLVFRMLPGVVAPMAVMFVVIFVMKQASARQRVMLEQARTELAERRRAEEALGRIEVQLRQTQKMEAIGRLAGGVAHDFNNLLSVVLSYCELLLDDPAQSESTRADVKEIQLAGNRATELTQQLLAFSRQQVVEPRVLDLNLTIASTWKMLQRVVGGAIELRTVPTPDLVKIKADPGHIEQVLMNLVVNARDAMPRGGCVTIETGSVVLGEEYALEHPGATPGPHIMLAVSDTGTGMDKETQDRIFEPFFTTKEKGKGTGLGLATVFGIVKQGGGSIYVYSEPGRGTTFKVYWPRTDENESPLRPTIRVSSTRGSETILLAEDDEQIRALTRKAFEKNGYAVLEACNGVEALAQSEKHRGVIDLLLTDVVMPKMNGRELAQSLAPTRPRMKVLYMSGYTEEAILHHHVLDPRIALLQKPITPDAMLHRVRDLLDA